MFILNKISKEYGDKSLFKDLDLTIYDGERIGIVGSNGSGKSTFMNILAGELKPDFGEARFDGNLSYVKQVAEKVPFESEITDEFLRFLKSNKELCFTNDLAQCFDSLSGGEKTKLMISYALSKNVDTLLLDEPTNNLDGESVEWLIDKINAFLGTVIVVSHDRYFLNSIAHSIIEFENGKIERYFGGYDDYEIQKQEKLDYQKKVYQNKLAENKKLKNQIAKLNAFTAKLEKSTKRDGSADKRSSGYRDSAQSKVKKLARQAQAKRSRLEALENDLGEKPFEKGEIFYRIQAQELHSKLLIKFTDVSKKFENKLLFCNANFNIENGEKIALCGANGCGKSTLIKIILGQEDFEGDIWKTGNLKIAYLPQNAFDIKDDQTILQHSQNFIGESRTQFLTNLCNMGMNRQMFSKKICNLSSGEKMKVKLNELILGDFNILILDEPTNNLDIENKKFLEEVLKNYKGSLIIVSHDRSFIENICNVKLHIKDCKIYKKNCI